MPCSSTPTLSRLPDSFHITIHGERAQRFMVAIQAVFDANESLLASVENFPDVDFSGRQIHPQIAVEGYTRFMQKKLECLFAILDDEDVSE